MNTRTTIKLFGACIALAGLTQALGQLQPPRATPTARYVEGELLVKFKGGPHGDAATRAKSAMKHEVKRHFDFIGWQHIRLPHGLTVEQGLERFRNLPDVLAVEPNFISEQAAGDVPNDPLLAQQYALEKIAASNAWSFTTGSSNIVVAVLDTGINYDHEDLAPNMWRNPGEIPGNGIDDDGNGFVDDVYGIDTAADAFGNDSNPFDEGIPGSYHGSACAGIIGAVGNNSRGTVGVNWSVQLMAVRLIKADDSINNADLVDALNYVVLMKQRGANIRVVSMSFVTGGSQAQKDAHDAVAGQDIIQVTGAHNNSRDIDVNPWYPAAYNSSNLITVAASTSRDDLASFSNYGKANVDLAAPGASVLTTDGAGTTGYVPFSGTSAACPHFAGAAALLFAAYPSLSSAQIKTLILDSVDVLPAFTNKMVTGGRLNIGRAFNFAAAPTNTPPSVVLQPLNHAVEEGDWVTFTVIASGTPPFRYRWQFNSADITGATNSALQLPYVKTNQAGGYCVFVTNAFGVATSDVAVLTVTPELNPVFTRITNSPVVMVSGNAIGGSWGDYDNDGNMDLFVPRGVGNGNDLLFRNDGAGAFTRITMGAIANDAADSWNGAWGDFDNDGDLDLLVACANGQSEILYRNDGGGNFSRMTAAQVGTLVSSGGTSYNCAWVDYDNDGWLDAFISNGGSAGADNEFLFHNNGDGTFTPITTSIIANDGRTSYGMTWADYDNDGRPDLFVANYGQTNRLYHNEGHGEFTRITSGDLVTEPGFNTGGAWGDYDNDGDFDLYVSRNGIGMLFRNDGEGTFTRTTTGAIVSETGSSDSATWGDYDNDGFLDMFVANEGDQNDFLYHNEGDGSFSRITASIVTKDGRSSIGCAWGDYDNDGQLDLFVPCFGTNSLLYHNNGNSNAWLNVKCVGTVANRSGIGAKVRVRANIGGTNRWQLGQISGGGGFGSQLQLLAHFGLGNATNVDVLRIEWPSGTVQELPNVGMNQFLTVTEPPRLQAVGLTLDGSFQQRLTGGIGFRYSLETSSNLNEWTAWATVTNSNRTMLVSDSSATNAATRFYRAVFLP